MKIIRCNCKNTVVIICDEHESCKKRNEEEIDSYNDKETTDISDKHKVSLPTEFKDYWKVESKSRC